MGTALTERISWCRTMANNASYNDGECEGYIAEMAGLLDVPLAASLSLHQGRYDLGCRDRRTLLLLAGTDSH